MGRGGGWKSENGIQIKEIPPQKDSLHYSKSRFLFPLEGGGIRKWIRKVVRICITYAFPLGQLFPASFVDPIQSK